MEPYLQIHLGADHAGKKPGMREIVDSISRQIESERRIAGSRMPPTRVLAHQLGVSKNTVTAAYEELQARSLIESRGRRGLYILPAQAFVLPKAEEVPCPAMKPLIRIGGGFPAKNAITLTSVFIDPALLPKEKLTACFRSVLKHPGLPDFSDRQGFLPLRKKIAERLRKRGISAEPEQIVTTVGSQQVLDLVYRSISTKTLATENPAFYVGKALFESHGITPLALPIDPFRGVDLKAWEAILARGKPALAYLTTNFQNPTGYSYSSQEIARILEWSREYGFGILEDDWGSDMLSYSEFKPSLRALGGDNVLYMNAFTKKLLPSLRIGYVVGNERTVPALVQAKRLSISSVPSVVEAALFEFLDRGYYDAHLKRLQAELDARYQHCLDLLRTQMPAEARWTSPGGGPVLWLELPRRLELTGLLERLGKKGIHIQPSHDAFFGKPHLHGFKIGYAFLSKPAMETAIDRLATELRKALSS